MLQSQLCSLIDSVRPDEVKELLRRVFEDLERLLGYLNTIESIVSGGGMADDVLPVFSIVHGETVALLDFITSEAERTYVPRPLFAALDSTVFAARLELRRVFEHELAGALAFRDASEFHHRMANAIDVLRNCYQQSTITLARLYKPTLDGVVLFENIRLRRARSLELYEDLRALCRISFHTEREYSRQSLDLFAERLADFHSRSMRHLMQNDWLTFEDFVNRFRALRTEAETRAFLHQFNCYLEILLGHVRMRSALSNSPSPNDQSQT